MAKNRFHEGMHILFRGREYEIDSRLPNSDLRLKDVVAASFTAVAELCLINAWFDGHLEFLGDTGTTIVRRKAAKEFIADLSALDDEDPRKKELKRRYAYLKSVVELVSDGVVKITKEILEPLIQKVHESIGDLKRPPHWKTLYYSWYRTLIITEDIRALTPQYNKRGNFNRKFSGSRRRAFSERDKENAEHVAEIVDEVIQEKYLSRQRNTVSTVYEAIVARIADENLYRTSGSRLPTPSERSIYDVVDQLDEYEVIKARYGKRIADLRCGMYKRGPQPKRPLQRVEIDHTKLDLFVIDPITRMPIGRPTLTIAIDKYTRMILGFYLSFNGPGFLSVMHCLRHAILPKAYVKKLYPSVEHSWNVYGIPELVAVDNGPEFHGDGVEDACLQLGFVILYCPVQMPWFKAVVERYFGTLNRKLLHELPGTTFSNIFEREDYDPSKNAIISLDTLLEIIHVFIIDYYSQRKHRGIKDVPAQRWDTAIEEFPPALPDKRDDLQVLLGDIEFRTIQPNGIALFDLTYNDIALAKLRNGRKGHRFKIKFDPADISVIYVLDPDSDRFIPVPADSQQYTKGLSLWQHKVIQGYARKITDDKVDIVALCRAKEKIIKIIERDWLKIAQSGPKGRMARFKNISQPRYEKQMRLESNADVHISHEEGVSQMDLRLTSTAPHVTGLSDLESAITTNSSFESESIQVPEANLLQVKKAVSSNSEITIPYRRAGIGMGDETLSPNIVQNDSDDDLDTSGWSTDELPRMIAK